MRIAYFALTFPFAVAACGGNSSTGPNPNPGGGQFSATIDGQAWVSSITTTTGGGSGSNQIPGQFNVTGTQYVGTSYTSVSLILGYIRGPGTYPLGVNAGTTAGGMGLVVAPQAAATGTWSTNLTGSAGTVTVSTLTGSRITGKFQFTAPPQAFSQTTGTRAVTNGQFDLPLPSNFVAAPATDPGSKVTASINGAAWNAATVVALGSQTVFGFTASTDSLLINISAGTVMQAGNSYPIGGPNGATMIATKVGTSSGWATGSTAVGTITLSTSAGGRASGTFSATLPAASGTSGALVIVNGTYDVKILTP